MKKIICLVFICSCAKNGEILEITISSADMGISCPTKVLYRDRQNAFLEQTEFIEVPEYITVVIENISGEYLRMILRTVKLYLSKKITISCMTDTLQKASAIYISR